MKHLRRYVGLLVLISFACLLASCDQKSSTGPSDSQQVLNIGKIQLSADTELYAVAGQSRTTLVTATVTDTLGAAVAGALVHFTTPEFGSISTTSDTTKEDGKVSVTFDSQGDFGLATITASVNAGTEVKTDQITIGVYELAGLPRSLYLAVEPAVVYIAAGTSDSLKATAVVSDSLGKGIQGIQVNFSTTLGSITVGGETDATGTAVTWLRTLEQFGMGVVTAQVLTDLPDTSSGESSGKVNPSLKEEDIRNALGIDGDELVTRDTFYVNEIDDRISALMVSASPPVLNVAQSEIGTSTIRATVVDDDNVGIPGVPVSFRTTVGGVLSSDAGLTDSTGSKSITFYSVAGIYDTVTVTAIVGSLEATTEVIVKSLATASGSIVVGADSHLIYADYGITRSNITALLKDADQQVIAGEYVIFTSDYGTVNSPVLTDSTGQARAIFQDIGFSSSPDSARVIAKYPTLDIADTVMIMIEPALGVDYIALSSATVSMKGNGTDTCRVDARVTLDNGSLAPTGTSVTFFVGGAGIGDFSPSVTQVVEDGTASTTYRAGITTGVDTLYAMVEGIISNPITMSLVPGPPSFVNVEVDTSTKYVNDTNPMVVTAVVTDTTGNPVANGEGVVFTVTLGSISPTSAQTVGGEATTYLLPGPNAGDSWITARVGSAIDSILVSFLPSEPAYINLTSDYSSIEVSLVGDTTQTAIHAHVKDPSGNPVGNDVMVHFEILNNGFPFGGVNINNHGIEDSTVTSGGTATVVLNAGTQSGPVQIRAWTYNSVPQEISAQQSLVTIVSGPPKNINIDAESIPDSPGGDVWVVEVSALVVDSLGNEVPDGVSVSFYVIPDTTAQIQGAAVTGNENVSGNTTPGVAYSNLTYQSDNIFDEVYIYAYCMVGGDQITGVQWYQLPIDEDASLSLSISPMAWNYSILGDPAWMEMNATLKDGHGNHVDGGYVRFQSPKGRGFWYTSGSGQSWEKITGPEGFPGPPPEPYDSTGTATLYLRTYENEAFPDMGLPQVTAQVTVVLMGYEDQISSQPFNITFEHQVDDGSDVPDGEAEDPMSLKALKE